MSRPTGLIATKGIELLTLGTPNGFKASILLEELKEAYGLQYTWQSIDISKNYQKEPWFIAVNPNGRIPAIVDHDHNDFPVFEGNAILGYLSRKYDTEHKFSFPVDSDEYTTSEAWIGWQHGGVGPMQGQANHFLRAAPEQIPWGIQRYVGETERLYGILNTQLSKTPYVVGGRFSIADISLLGWIAVGTGLAIDFKNLFPHVKAWFDRCYARPGVQRGFEVPSKPAAGLFVEPDEAQKKVVEDRKKVIDAAKEKYNYKYTSP